MRSPTLRWLSVFLILLLVHFPVSQELIWDDELLIGNNPWTHSWSSLKNVWFQNLWYGIPGEHIQHWYRPLLAAHLIIDQKLLGTSIIARQLINLCWLGISLNLLIHWIQLRQPKFDQYGLLVLLLCSTPINLELIHFVASRNDLMAMTFVLAGVLLWESKRMNFIPAFLLLLGLLSKESSLVWLIVFTVGTKTEIKAKTIATMFVPIIVWWWMRSNAIHSSPELPDLSITLLFQATQVPQNLLNPIQSPLGTLHQSFSVIGSLIVLSTMLIGQNKHTNILFIFACIFTALSASQSTSFGLRYSWMPLLLLVVWWSSLKINRIIRCIIYGIGGYQLIISLINKPQWTNNHNFWMKGVNNHPSSMTYCGAFMQSRHTPAQAIPLLIESLSPPPMNHCCLQASRYPLELNDPKLAISIGEVAIKNKCKPMPELITPLSYAYASSGEWERSIELISMVSNDPFGLKAIIEIANDLRMGSEESLNQWASKGDPNNPDASTESVKQVLREKAELLLK